MPATHLDQVFAFFHNRPVRLEDFDELYAPADRGRSKAPVYNKLKRRLVQDPGGSLKMLFAGHKGCGKTTELVRLQKDIGRDFIVLNFSALTELDILNISYMELFIVAMHKLFEFVRDTEGIRVDPIYLKSIRSWLKSREIEEINQNYMGVDVDTEAKAGVSIPFLTEFFAKFKASAKSSSSMKEVLKMKLEPKLSDLILNCNLLINEIKRQLPQINKKGLLILFEDLDKADLSKGEDIFYVHAAQLTQLNCHCIFTFPIALLYNIRYSVIKTNYSEEFVLPMIKVRLKEGGEYEEGISVMRDIVKRRMDLSLFRDIEILNDMIRYSGGCLWDLFQMIKDAADNALDLGRDTIDREDYQAAYNALKRDYEFTIAENPQRKTPVEQYYEALKKCAQDPVKKPDGTEIMLDLKNNRTVLCYNDDYWGDVHPIVREILKERGWI